MIDAGVDTIYLEESEFWAKAGYSESFKKRGKNIMASIGDHSILPPKIRTYPTIGSKGISVLLANSLMFQQAPDPIEGYEDQQLSNFTHTHITNIQQK